MNSVRPAPWLLAFAAAIALTACGRSGGDSGVAQASRSVDTLEAPSAAPSGFSAAAGRRAATSAAITTGRAVGADMRNVYFHIDTGIILRIARLHGALIPTHADAPPRLDDNQSFVLSLESAEIGIDTASLSTLLNRHVFGYRGSPLKRLKVRVEGDHLVQTGVMHKGVDMPFRILATIALTAEGEIRLHPTNVKVFGVGAEGVMKLFHLNLGKLITLQPGHGARIEKDDFILDPTAILPPPAIKGRLTSISLTPYGMVQTFGATGTAAVTPLHRPQSTAPNYMYFHGATLRFGKLTMAGADLEIVDKDPSNPFDYSPDRYLDHLVAGTEFTTPVGGLIVHMPDLGMLPPRIPAKAQAGTR